MGRYERSTRDKSLDEVGFIHCSFESQVDGTFDLIYGDHPEPLVLLEIDPASLERAGIEVRVEDGGNGTHFPHIYGALPCDLVSQVEEFRRG